MKKINKEEFVAAIKTMKHTGFASPLFPYDSTIEYFENETHKARYEKWPDGTEEFIVEEKTDPAEED